MCQLSNDIYDYYNVAQGKITIPNVDDGEECLLTDVSLKTIDRDISNDPLEMLQDAAHLKYSQIQNICYLITYWRVTFTAFMVVLIP